MTSPRHGLRRLHELSASVMVFAVATLALHRTLGRRPVHLSSPTSAIVALVAAAAVVVVRRRASERAKAVIDLVGLAVFVAGCLASLSSPVLGRR